MGFAFRNRDKLNGLFTLAIVLVVGCSASGCSAQNSEMEAQASETETQVARIDKARLLGHIETLSSDAFMGRRTATEGGEMAVNYVRSTFEEIGIKPCFETLDMPFEFTSRRTEEVTKGMNVVGFVSGTGSSSLTMVITAHFDHLGVRQEEIYNGADDNASGTGALLELARYFVNHPPVHSMIFAGLDAEELGLQGARALVGSTCVTEREIALNINMDMISRSPKGELYAVGTRHYPFLAPTLESLPPHEGVTLLLGHDEPGTGSDDWTNASDHGPFHQSGIPFVYFGVEDHPGYHNPTDDFADITPAFYYQTTELILDAIRTFDATLDDLTSQGVSN